MPEVGHVPIHTKPPFRPLILFLDATLIIISCILQEDLHLHLHYRIFHQFVIAQ